MHDDIELLRRFQNCRDEAAFGEVVRRNIDFVYRVALRQVNGDEHLARDVTQEVFLTLARKSRDVLGHRALAGWLHHTARNCARAAIRSSRRWQAREREAQMMIHENQADPAADWSKLGPVLDEALQEMDASDREAVLMRYYENRPFAELGARLGVAENAARMRVDRALDKLRSRLERRGVTSTAAALGGILTAQPAISAPAALGALVLEAALAGSASAAGIGTAAAATTILMTTNKIIATGAGIAALFVIGYIAGSNGTPVPASTGIGTEERLRSQVTQLRQENQGLVAELRQLQAAAAPAKEESTVATADGNIPYNPGVPPRIAEGAAAASSQTAAIMNNLRQIATAADVYSLEKGRPPESINDLVGPDPGKFIKAIVPVESESYANLEFSPGGTLSVTTASGMTVTFGGSGGGGSRTPYQAATDRARAAFRGAHGDRTPIGYELAPYFDDVPSREAFVDAARVTAVRRYIDPALNPALNTAGSAYNEAYKTAHGSSAPKTFEAMESMASFIENDADRAAFVAALRKVRAESPD